MTDYRTYSEKDLIRLLKEGHEGAMRPLYDQYVKTLHYFIIRTAKSKQLAEDVVHDVFIKLWENREKLDPEQSFKTYLFSMAKNHLLNLLNRLQHETHILEEIRRYSIPAEATTDLQLDYVESNALIHEAMEKLPLKCREVFINCKIDGLSYQETADKMGISTGTVNSQMVKALAFIQEYITLKNTLTLLVTGASIFLF